MLSGLKEGIDKDVFSKKSFRSNFPLEFFTNFSTKTPLGGVVIESSLINQISCEEGIQKTSLHYSKSGSPNR